MSNRTAMIFGVFGTGVMCGMTIVALMLEGRGNPPLIFYAPFLLAPVVLLIAIRDTP